ncbi:MAG: hypothetical protein Q8911_16290, partial [Bacillota bacterium]|nr:hypothetical protein [Bacillota bacterium]
MEANLINRLLLKKEYCISFYSLPTRNPYFDNDISPTKTGNNPAIQREKIGDKNYPNRIQDISEV